MSSDAKTLQLHIRLDPVLFQRLSEKAKRMKLEKSVIVRDVLRAALSGEADMPSDIAEIKRDVAKNTEQYELLLDRLALILEGGRNGK